MLLPKQISEDLKCVRCEGSLSVIPVMVNVIGNRVCGRCFKLLPSEEQEGFVREISYEKLATLFRFKCRYHSEGCDFEYPFNRGLEHETFCTYKYRTTLRKPSYVNNEFVEINKKSLRDDQVLLKGNNYINNLSLQTLLTDDENCLENVKSTTCLLSKNEKFTCIGLEMGLYDNVKSNCKNCDLDKTFYNKKNMEKTSTLVRKSSGNNYQVCKNFPWGCTAKLKSTEVNMHELDCEFGKFICPIAKCDYANFYSDLRKHLIENHNEIVLITDTTNKTGSLKDQLWIQIVYNSIFVCKYFWYEEHDEFVAEYLGSQKNACKYKFQVEILGNLGKTIVRNKICQGWNGKYLDEAIIITDKELKKNNTDELNFDYNFKIMPA